MIKQLFGSYNDPRDEKDECYETYYCTCGKYKKVEESNLCKACLL